MNILFLSFFNLILISNSYAGDWLYDFSKKKCVPSKAGVEDFFEYIEEKDSSCKISETKGLYFIDCKISKKSFVFTKQLSDCNKWDNDWQKN